MCSTFTLINTKITLKSTYFVLEKYIQSPELFKFIWFQEDFRRKMKQVTMLLTQFPFLYY